MNGYEHELLQRISEKVAAIDERTIAIKDRLEVGDVRLNNHTERIGSLERWRSRILGVVAALAALFGWKLL